MLSQIEILRIFDSMKLCKKVLNTFISGAALNVYDVNSRVPASPMYKLRCVGTEKTIQKCHREPVEDCGKLGGIQCRSKNIFLLIQSQPMIPSKYEIFHK